MHRSFTFVMAALLMAALTLTACIQPIESGDPAAGSGEEAESEVVTIYVGPELAECVGVGPMECMLVKTDPNDEYEYFYQQIDGFEFEPGYEYELLVQVDQVENPPADGSSLIIHVD